jgi:predicted RNA binding protein YcfA (HicA-like mRNA interferase family)
MSAELPLISGQDCIKLLEKIGFVVARQRGSHITMRRKEPAQTISVPNHKELDRGTLRGIIRSTGLTVEACVALLKN